MKLSKIHPQYADWVKDLKGYAQEPSLWQKQAKKALRDAQKGYKSIDAALEGLSRIQRLRWIFTAGLQNDAAFKAETKQLDLPTWADYVEPPAARGLQKSLADKLFAHVSKAKWDKPMISVENGSRAIGPMLVKKAIKGGFPAVVNFGDRFQALVLARTDAAGAKRLAEDYLATAGTPISALSAAPGNKKRRNSRPTQKTARFSAA